jgi:spore germination cell wall hydrolase CwlJ-like protein
MCLLAGNLVIKALPNTEVGGTYTYYNDQSVHNVTQATKEDENDEPTIFVKEIVETKVVNFSQGKHELTDDERALAEQIVACEAGADSLEGQMAVAQCLYDSAVLDGLTIQQVFKKYGYSSLYNRKVTAENELAVSMVFDYGAKISDKPIQWFVTPTAAPGSWHERGATFAGQFGAHRFYYDSKLVVDDAE